MSYHYYIELLKIVDHAGDIVRCAAFVFQPFVVGFFGHYIGRRVDPSPSLIVDDGSHAVVAEELPHSVAAHCHKQVVFAYLPGLNLRLADDPHAFGYVVAERPAHRQSRIVGPAGEYPQWGVWLLHPYLTVGGLNSLPFRVLIWPMILGKRFSHDFWTIGAHEYSTTVADVGDGEVLATLDQHCRRGPAEEDRKLAVLHGQSSKRGVHPREALFQRQLQIAHVVRIRQQESNKKPLGGVGAVVPVEPVAVENTDYRGLSVDQNEEIVLIRRRLIALFAGAADPAFLEGQRSTEESAALVPELPILRWDEQRKVH